MQTTKVYSYLRFSDAKQAAGNSAARQSDFAIKWAADHGMVLDNALSMRDEGLSAYHQKHIKIGALGVFLEAVNAGRIPVGSVLIVEALDRLSRAAPMVAQPQLAQIINAGITVVTASDGKVYNFDSLKANPMDLVYSLLMMIRAHEESDTKSKRVKAAVRRQCEDWISGKRRARIVNGRDPGWLRWNGEAFEVIPERAEGMRMVVKMFLEGNGFVRIAKELAKCGLAVTGANATGWIYALIRRPDLIGVRLLKADGEDFRLEDYYPRLISDEDFARLQLEYARRRQAPRAAGGKSLNPGIFTGINIGTCGVCGSKLISNNQARPTASGGTTVYRRMSCKTCCSKVSSAGSTSAWKIEKAILDYCSDQMNLDSLLPPSNSASAVNAQRVKLLSEIAELEAKQQTILDAALDSPGGLPQVVLARLRKMETDIAEARQRESLLAAEGLVSADQNNTTTAQVWADLREGVIKLDYDSRIKCRKIIGETFSRIQVYFKGALPDSPADVMDIMLVSKVGVSRWLRINKTTGEMLRGLNLNQDGRKLRGWTLDKPAAEENVIAYAGSAAD